MSNTYPATIAFSANVDILLGATLAASTGPIANTLVEFESPNVDILLGAVFAAATGPIANTLVEFESPNVDILLGAVFAASTGPIANNLIDLRFIGESVSSNTVTVVESDTQVWIG